MPTSTPKITPQQQKLINDLDAVSKALVDTLEWYAGMINVQATNVIGPEDVEKINLYLLNIRSLDEAKIQVWYRQANECLAKIELFWNSIYGDEFNDVKLDLYNNLVCIERLRMELKDTVFPSAKMDNKVHKVFNNIVKAFSLIVNFLVTGAKVSLSGAKKCLDTAGTVLAYFVPNPVKEKIDRLYKKTQLFSGYSQSETTPQEGKAIKSKRKQTPGTEDRYR